MSPRFQPPPLTLSPEARWMLLRAFGPAAAPVSVPVDAPAALALSRRFEVSARIAARQGRERLTVELGSEAAAGFARDRAAAAAVAMRLMAAAEEIAALAATATNKRQLAIPLTFLKLAGLESAGILAAGSRGACDLDVLVPAGRAEELWQALAAAGWQGAGPSYEHQLPALAHPERGVVEVHRLIPGLRLGGNATDASAAWEDLEREGLLLPLPDLPGRCSVAVPEVQAAHALVHGLGQHGFTPAAYSLLKMMADLQDLGDGALTPRALAWVARDVPPGEAAAVRRLGARLAAGEDPAAWATGAAGDPPEATLLRHILAGRLDADYASTLRLGLFRPPPGDRGPAVRLARAVWGAIALSDAQIDGIYGSVGANGRPRSRLGYFCRRLARPFDLILRLGSYGVRWLKLRLASQNPKSKIENPPGYTPPP
ncbi:MAG TPA: nucleotidyltransferase family protein [Thermoanaerobaculia bacterium]|nr:nucleotidyltransferase family protein [Thermoanaerobaculia bacterium]